MSETLVTAEAVVLAAKRAAVTMATDPDLVPAFRAGLREGGERGP